MLEFVFDVFWFMCGISVEVFLFNIVKRITKEFLGRARNTTEQQAVWLLECALLFFLCAVVYVHHTAYFLFAMAWLTLMYAIFLHNVEVRNNWRNVRTIWHDFVEYTDSFRGRNTCGCEQTPPGRPLASQVPPAGLQDNTVPNIPVCESEPSLASPAGRGGTSPLNRLCPEVPAPDNFSTPDVPSAGAIINQQLGRSSSQPLGTQPSTMRKVPPSDSVMGKEVSDKGVNKTGNNVKTSLVKVVRGGINFCTDLFKPSESDGSHPPGLVNNREQNLCFINCVLQTLSRSPRLSNRLESALASGCTQNLSVGKLTFLREVAAIFRKLTVQDEEEVTPAGKFCFHKMTLDTSQLRKAISTICAFGLIADPSTRAQQRQQDASEFLLWLLETLHDALKVQPSTVATSIYTRPGIHQPFANPNDSSQESLNKLKAAYNNPSPNAINLQRKRCLDQIASANGRRRETYMRPLVMISDLEWLVYKDQNNSIVDNMFTGQSVSARFCNACDHMSVVTDTFRILTLPIPSGSDCFSIEDCFGQLKMVEKLTGSDRPRCEFCEAQNVLPGGARNLHPGSHPVQTSTPNGPVHLRSGGVRSPDIGVLSPIQQVNLGARVLPSSYTTPVSRNPSQPRNTDCMRQTSLRHLPDCLIVQLLRFGYSNKEYKINTRVRVSADTTDLSWLVMVWMTQPPPMLYSLCGVCLHISGSTTSSGHYVAYSLASDGHWYCFNDTVVKKVEDIESVLDKNDVQEGVYLLFYRKVQS